MPGIAALALDDEGMVIPQTNAMPPFSMIVCPVM